jgi:hypothetical protein
MTCETITRQNANPGDPNTAILADHAGACSLSIAAARRLVALADEGRASRPSDNFPDWGAMASADVGLVSSLAMLARLPETVKPGQVGVIIGLTVMTYPADREADARAFAAGGF